MTEKGKGRKRISEHIEVIVDEAKSAAADAIHQSESIGENLKQTLQGALSARENVVMVRTQQTESRPTGMSSWTPALWAAGLRLPLS